MRIRVLTCVLLFVAVASATPVSVPLSPPLPRSLLEQFLKAHAPAAENDDAFAQPAPYIVDGQVAAARAAPYLVSLSLSAVAYAHTCAGVIIGKEWVLTAAHCVRELEQVNDGAAVGLPVYAGLQNRNNLSEAQVHHIDFAFAHKEFSGEEGSDDIALLHVTPPLVFSAKVRQIALPYANEDYAGEASATYGWGLTDPAAEQYAKELQSAQATVLSGSECKQQLPKEAPVSRHQICANAAACYGDGGSPLVAEREGGVAELIGITSWGYLPCGYDNRPTVYTAVSKYVEWIAQVQWAYYILH